MEISKLNAAELSSSQSARAQEKSEVSENAKEQVKSEGAAEMQKSVQVEEKYEAVSKDGDTLQLSEKSATKLKIGKQIKIEDIGIKAPGVSVKMSDATLSKYSSGKLKQLLSQGQISRQQYDKAMKKLSQ